MRGGDAARVGVFDNHHGRRIELGDALEGGVGVVEIVVGQLAALGLARGGDAGPVAVDVERGLLMRVFAVAQILPQLAADGEPVRQFYSVLRGEPGGDCGIVRGGAGIGLAR